MDGYHWYYRPGVHAGVISSNADTSCVCVAAPASRYRELQRDLVAGYHRLLREAAPSLAEMLGGSAPVRLRPFAGRTGFLRKPSVKNTSPPRSKLLKAVRVRADCVRARRTLR
jgi:hypothetical protein